MTGKGGRALEDRVVQAAEAALAKQKHVSVVDVFLDLGWLAPSQVGLWRQGRVDCLEGVIEVGRGKTDAAIEFLRRWAKRRGLSPAEIVYVARTRKRQPLRFSESGDPVRELAYRTDWISPELSDRERERLTERRSRPPDLVVVSPLQEWSCTVCGGTGAFLLMEDSGPVCLRCADMDHLVFLPAGDAALTTRAKRASRLAAVVTRFSRSRRRYERQGILVEEAALERAELECLANEEARARRRLREQDRRAAADLELQARTAQEIRRLFPGCPRGRADAIARHAAARGSGRVGRTAAGRALDPEAVTLAVVASVRHEDTRYDELLMSGLGRAEARQRVRPEVERILERWRRPRSPLGRATRSSGAGDGGGRAASGLS